MNDLTWIRLETRLPPEGQVVETLSPGGLEQQLRRGGNLWFDPNTAMYVYYTPVAWRPAP